MKKKFICVPIVLLTAYILFFPAKAVNAAGNGLSLWYERVLPTLLPFAILSNILISSNYMEVFTKYLSPLVKTVLPVSEAGSFVVCTGFFFGFPMGSKNCAELLKDGKLAISEAKTLFVATNNISPVFIGSYILMQQLRLADLFAVSLAVLYGPPLAFAAFRLRKNKASRALRERKTASGFQISFKIIDAGILNGFETLARIGGYIMLFSIVISMVETVPAAPSVRAVLCCALELTNGVSMLAETSLNIRAQYVLAMTAAAFGGLSGLAQTSSMCRGTPLSIKSYLAWKLLLTLCSFLLAVLVAAIRL